jgi:hypothetical protein
MYITELISLIVKRSKIRQILCILFSLLPAASLSLYWIKGRFEYMRKVAVLYAGSYGSDNMPF